MNSKPSISMYDFFYEELKTLKVRTGLRQWETLNESSEAKQSINELITMMCKECQNEGFALIRPDVKQRVIRDAIMNDQDFIGLNPKFVRKALNHFWGIHGEKIIQARDAEERKNAPAFNLSEEEKKKIDARASAYIAQILTGDGMQRVPKLRPGVAEKEGAEWKSDLEQSASKGYVPPTAEYLEKMEQHRQYVRENYELHTGKPLETWISENEWLEKHKSKTYE